MIIIHLNNIIDIEYVEFFEVGNKVILDSICGVVVQTYTLSDENLIIGGSLVICWDSRVDCDFEICSPEKESHLIRIEDSYQFKYINDDGTSRIY